MLNEFSLSIFISVLCCSLAIGNPNSNNAFMCKPKVENATVTKVENKVKLDFSLCNHYAKRYYLEKRFSPERMSEMLVGFSVIQNGKTLDYRGIYAKLSPSLFPEDYVRIDPDTCIDIKVNLSRYFQIDLHKRAEVHFSILNVNPVTEDVDNIFFTFDYVPQ